MNILITGATSGIGYEMAKILYKDENDLILVGKDSKKIEKIKKEFSRAEVIELDLSDEKNCIMLHEKFNDIDFLINNAGFGVFGELDKTELEKEIALIKTNITSLMILTKLYLKDFKKKDNGYILNVASSAAFSIGPLMANYYASKSYVLKLSQAVKEELRVSKSNVKISVLCPGPVDTNFNNVAKVKFSIKPLTSSYVAEYAINKTLKNKFLIIPSFKMKLSYIMLKFIPDSTKARITYKIQAKKDVNKK